MKTRKENCENHITRWTVENPDDQFCSKCRPNPPHTPGPWTVEGRAIDSTQYEIAVASIGLDSDGNEMPLEECDANARLIASAPDLLEALRSTIGMFNRPEDYWDEEGQPTEECNSLLNTIRNVVEKAEGKI